MTALELFRFISLHHIWHNKIRMVFVLLIIAIGSTSMFIAVDSIFKRDDSRRFGTSLLHGRASISIEASADNPITPAMLRSIRADSEVEAATPIILDSGLLLDQSLLLPIIGIDPDSEMTIRPYALSDGNFITEAGQVLVTDAFAENVAVGDTLHLASLGGLRSYTVAGILAQESIAALNGGDMFFLHYQDVQDLHRSEDFDFISIIPANSIEDTITALQSVLPDGISIKNINDTGEKTLTDYVIDVLGIISNGLPAVLGALMITSTLSASVVQRRKELAILRSLGTTQRGLLNILIVEAIILGLLGSVLGVLLAVLLNQGGLTESVTVENLSATAQESVTPIWIYGVVVFTGVAMSIGAMWLPARRIITIDPTEAMRPPVAHIDSRKSSRLRILAGITMLILAVVCRFAFDNSQLVPLAVLTGILFVLIGTILLFSPIVIGLSHRLPGMLRGISGFSGLMAAENLNIRHQRAIATGLTALLIVWFYVLLLGFTNGQSYLASHLVDAEFDYDLIISGPGEDARTTITTIPTNTVEAISTRDDVDVVIKERLAPYVFEEADFTIRAVDLATYFDAGYRFAWENGDEDAAYQQLLDHTQPAVLVGGFDALLLGLRQTGHTITLSTPRGDVDFEVVGTINAPGGNTIVMDRALYMDLWDDPQVNRLSINFVESADVQQIRRTLSQRYITQGLIFSDRDEIRALFAQVAGFDFAAGLILFPFMMLGIANMLFISVLDRRREFGMLRAIGTFRRQIVQSVVIEALILVTLACCVAIPAAFLAMDMMLFARIAGAIVRPDFIILARTVIVILIVAGIAAYLPARRAGRLDILDALRYE